ncbi:MAG: diguanylate cyclase [Thermodesulfobacteriota bacterium]
MDNDTPQDLKSHPFKVADRTWWVGAILVNDTLQCHTFLIEQGKNSILLDPGSLLTFPQTRKKIEQIVPFDHIRYFICHHPDPDITAALPQINEMVTRDDAMIICHGRTKALLRHFDLDLDYYLIEDNDWKLELDDRCLEFVFTPYAHFPGAFCTFDHSSGNLFSSDLFGGFTKEFSLFARDDSYFESLRPFHEHYIPSNQVLTYALSEIEKLPVQMILPQHGSIISEDLVPDMISRLKKLDCGLFLMGSKMDEIIRLSELNTILHEISEVIAHAREFKDIAEGLLEITARFLPVNSLEFYTRLNSGQVLHLAPDNRYRGKPATPPPQLNNILGARFSDWQQDKKYSYKQVLLTDDARQEKPNSIIVPLIKEDLISGIAVLHPDSPFDDEQGLDKILAKLRIPLQVAIEREAIYRTMDIERQQIYDRASRDPLTQLYTRFYMQDSILRLFELQDRNQTTDIALALLDIDHFKTVNDTFGHNNGDLVLKTIAALILEQVRSSDLPVRLGGEEFALFLIGASMDNANAFAERLRESISELHFPAPMDKHKVTVSIGVAARQPYEALEDFIEKGDLALYKAKNSGRNKVKIAS